MGLSEELFRELSGIDSGILIESGGGFALISGSDIRLLCVAPERQGNGTGSRLLAQAEEHIRNSGGKHAVIGGSGSRLLIGAPEKSAGFFTKRGYDLSERVAEMYGKPEFLDLDCPECPGAEFGFYGGDVSGAVAAVDPDWVQYFGESEVYCGIVDGEIASFCLLDEDVKCIFPGRKVGSIGCVGTVPEFRRRGIGLRMVAEASRELIRRGCDRIFIHYTGVYDWYARLGYRTGIMLRMGGKRL